jgi:thiamine pyrophosphokinase
LRALIFANGVFDDARDAQRWLRWADYVIAADGGTRHALGVGRVPDVVIGDLDSLDAAARFQLENAGAHIISFPARKDETDLELALCHAVQFGAREIVILGALGGRLDQTLANLMLLALPELAACAVRIVAGAESVSLARGGEGPRSIEGRPGDTVSLIPVGGDAAGVTALGLEWPLARATLRMGPARGVSNVMTAPTATVSLEQGLLLCIHAARKWGGEPCNGT